MLFKCNYVVLSHVIMSSRTFVHTEIRFFSLLVQFNLCICFYSSAVSSMSFKCERKKKKYTARQKL